MNSQVSAQYRTITTRFIVWHNQWATGFWEVEVKCGIRLWLPSKSIQCCLRVDRLHSLWKVLGVIRGELSKTKVHHYLYAGITKYNIMLPNKMSKTCLCRDKKSYKPLPVRVHIIKFSQCLAAVLILNCVLSQHWGIILHSWRAWFEKNERI